MSRQATDQLYIELDYYYPEEYYVYTAEAVAAVSSSATMSCSAGKIVNAVVAQVTLFNVGVQAFVTTSASTDLSASYVMTVSADKVKTANITLQTIVTLSLQGVRTRTTSAALTTTASVSATAIEYESYISSSPTPLYALGQALITTDQTHFGSHSLSLPNSTSGAISASTTSKFNIDSDFSIAFWYYSTGNTVGTYDDIVSWYDTTNNTGWIVQRTATRGIRFFIDEGATSEQTLTNTTLLTLNDWNWVVVTRTGTTLEIYINGTQRAVDTSHSITSGGGSNNLRIGDLVNGSAVGYLDGLHITIGGTISTAVPTEETLGSVTGSKLLLNWNGTWFDQSESELEQGSAALSSTATVSATAKKLVGTGVVLNSTATVSATGETVIQAVASLSSSATVTASALRIKTTDVTLSSEFTVTASAEDLDLAAAALTATSTLSATFTVIKQAASGVTSNATVTAVAQATKSATASLTCQGFFVAVGLDLDLASAALTATVTLSCSAIKTVRAVSAQSAAFTQTLQPLRILQLASTLTSAFTLSSNETRLKDVFVSGSLGQVYFRNTLSTDGNYYVNEGDKFIQIGGYNNNYGFVDAPAIAFWASGKGYIWDGVGGDTASNYENSILLTDTTFEYYFYRAGSYYKMTWSGIDTLVNNHYLLFAKKLWVNGADQGAPTIDTNTSAPTDKPYMYGAGSGGRTLALSAEGPTDFSGSIQEPGKGFQGALGQYVRWVDAPYGIGVPNFNLSTERDKLYNGGYVDIGSDGTSTGLVRAFEYLRLDNYTDTVNRGQGFAGFPVPNGVWHQLGTTVGAYRLSLNYTATEQDDVGPFAAVSTLTVTPITVLIVAANLATTATVTATATKLIGIIKTLDSVATVSATANRLRSTSADLVVAGSELVIAVKTGRALIDCAVVATMTTGARADFSGQASLTSTATMSCGATAIKRAVSNITAVSTTVTVNGRLRNNAIVASTVATLTTVARKDTGGIAVLQTNFTLTGSPFTTWRGEVYMNSNAAVTANAIAGYIASSNMTVTATMTVSATRTRSFTAAFSAFNTQLTIGTKITMDPYYQLVVARELSVKKIRQETAILTLDAENRLNTVQLEDRTLRVPRETSTWHIPYSPQVGTRRVK